MNKNQSVNVLVRMALALALVTSVIVWQHEYLLNLYIRNQATSVGYVINGAIVVLFLLGLIQMIRLFMLYRVEEIALDTFEKAVKEGKGDNLKDLLPATSIIGQRYNTVLGFFSARTEINHNALAATLLARESSRTSFIKFINNILILSGVFGTIVSLTVALLGASTAISATDSMRGIDVVIHGMSTALSTTMTAILAYFLYGYFYLKLLDNQSYILGRVEHLTATVLMPRYQAATRSPEQNMNEMFANTVEAITKIDTFINQINNINTSQHKMFSDFEKLTKQNMELLMDIRSILRAGFRLRDDNRDEK